MSKYTVAIRMDNSAFEDDPGAELARILRRLADGLERGGITTAEVARLYDVNGNNVGEAVAR